ncbi:MAG: ATP-binding protein [Butyrivibrio sp.]|nr:ATP-binding protein [Butyrivibrio sp.]
MPKKSLKIKVFVVLYFAVALAAVTVTYNYDNIRFRNSAINYSLELSDSLADTITGLLRMRLENLEIFTEAQLKYIFEDKEQLSRSLEYFEKANDMKLYVAERDKGYFCSDGSYINEELNVADGFFDTRGGFADTDLDGDGKNECAVYCVDELSDGRRIMTVGVYTSESLGRSGRLLIPDNADEVYFVRGDGSDMFRLDKNSQDAGLSDMKELAARKAVNAGERVRTAERGNLMFKNEGGTYALAYSELGIEIADGGYYIVVINKTGPMFRESVFMIYKIISELVFFLILGIPFAVIYQKYIKTDMELADSISANEAKTRFLSKFSHDFRTPMNALVGMVELAGACVNDPREVSYCLNKITTSADYMLEMLSDILDISKIESDKLELVEEPFNLMEIIRSINSLMYVQAENKKITFTIKKKISSDIFLIGDSVRLKQILVNLISNAVKFTEEGGKVQFHADETSRDGERVHMRFRVMDDGIGMSREFMKKMYEPFECERKNGVRGAAEGTGLGLSICNSLVKLMGGSIEAQSRLGEGTEFAVDIDFAYKIKNRGYRSNTANVCAKYDFGGRRVLLTDDNLTNLDITSRQLKLANIRVDMATDGQKAVKKYLDSPIGYYDAILMDIQMPVENGLEAAKEIRQSGRADAESIPIAAMSANAFGEEKAAAAECGMNIYLTKPIKMQLLYASLDKIFADRRAAGSEALTWSDAAAASETLEDA